MEKSVAEEDESGEEDISDANMAVLERACDFFFHHAPNLSGIPQRTVERSRRQFIEKYGTHMIVGISIGWPDVILMKQTKSSNLEPSQLKNQLEDLGDQLFNGACSFSPHQL
nr:hypothetical protein [Tanacetum cinerariifolium]